MIECKYFDHHTEGPDFWIRWQGWAANMLQTHYQVKCKHCNRWAIWLRKVPNPWEKFDDGEK
jgi:hypothetical protein